MSKIIELTDQNFDEEVLQSDIPVLVDFWAPWCQPCLIMSPILDELAKELDGRIKIVKINTGVSSHQQLAIRYEIRSIPNMQLFKDGKVIKEFVGLRSKQTFKTELETEIQ